MNPNPDCLVGMDGCACAAPLRAPLRPSPYPLRAWFPNTVAMRGVKPPTPAPLGVGDKVQKTITGYVRRVNDDGTVDLADTREPFADITVRGVKLAPEARIQTAPPAPKVGDTITGRWVRETPWRRGTVLRNTTVGDDEGDRYALLGTGQWINLDDDDDPATFGFGEYSDTETYVVELAPGKGAA